MAFARLIQHRADDGRRRVILTEGVDAVFRDGVETTRALAASTIAAAASLADAARKRRSSTSVDIAAEFEAGRLLSAIGDIVMRRRRRDTGRRLFEIEAPFALPLANPLANAEAEPVTVRAL